jgi:hypothetical protein
VARPNRLSSPASFSAGAFSGIAWRKRIRSCVDHSLASILSVGIVPSSRPFAVLSIAYGRKPMARIPRVLVARGFIREGGASSRWYGRDVGLRILLDPGPQPTRKRPVGGRRPGAVGQHLGECDELRNGSLAVAGQPGGGIGE